jgi:hypothetical protein
VDSARGPSDRRTGPADCRASIRVRLAVTVSRPGVTQWHAGYTFKFKFTALGVKLESLPLSDSESTAGPGDRDRDRDCRSDGEIMITELIVAPPRTFAITRGLSMPYHLPTPRHDSQTRLEPGPTEPGGRPRQHQGMAGSLGWAGSPPTLLLEA